MSLATRNSENNKLTCITSFEPDMIKFLGKHSISAKVPEGNLTSS